MWGPAWWLWQLQAWLCERQHEGAASSMQADGNNTQPWKGRKETLAGKELSFCLGRVDIGPGSREGFSACTLLLSA